MRLRSAGLTIAANAAIAADPALLGVPRSSAIKTVSVLKFLFDSFYRVNVKKGIRLQSTNLGIFS